MANVIDLKKFRKDANQPAKPAPVVLRPPVHPGREQLRTAIQANLPAVLVPRQSAPTVHSPFQNLLFPERSPVTWEAPVMQSVKPRRLAYLAGAMSLVAVTAWLLQKDIYLAVFFAVTLGVLMLLNHRGPQQIRTEISATGVSVAGRFYPYERLKSFWVEHTPGGLKELSLQMDSWYVPYLKVPLGEQDPFKVRTALISYLPEEQHEVSLMDVWFKSGDY